MIKPSALFDEKTAKLKALIRPIALPGYTVDVPFSDLEHYMERYSQQWGLNLAPDFQRGHVWTPEQRIAFLEGILRGTVGDSQRLIQFNAPHWDSDVTEGDLPEEIQIIDGLQRLSTVRQFMSGKLKAFGLHMDDFNGSSFSLRRSVYALRFAIHSFTWRSDLLQYYLDINTGGTVHSESEIARVTQLLVDSKREAQAV